MQKFFFEILVLTALTVGLIWTILELTPKSALLSFTILYKPYIISSHRLRDKKQGTTPLPNSRTVVEKNTDNLNVLLSTFNSLSLTLKHAGGGRFCPLSVDMDCIPSTFIKTYQIFLGKLRMVKIGPRGR